MSRSDGSRNARGARPAWMLAPLLAAALSGCQPAALAPPAPPPAREVVLRAQVPADSVHWRGAAGTVLLSLREMEAAAPPDAASMHFVEQVRQAVARQGGVAFRGPDGLPLIAKLLDTGQAAVRTRDGQLAPVVRSVRERVVREGGITLEERVFYLADGTELLRLTDTIILP